MPMLDEMIGLYSVHHPKSTFRCTHCHVTKAELHDFSKENWPFRTVEELERLGSEVQSKQSVSSKKSFAKANYGIQVSKVLH